MRDDLDAADRRLLAGALLLFALESPDSSREEACAHVHRLARQLGCRHELMDLSDEALREARRLDRSAWWAEFVDVGGEGGSA